MSRVRNRLALLTLLFANLTGPALAAGPLGLATAGSAAPAAPAAAPAKEALAPGDIPTRADFDERFVQDVMRRAQGRDPSAKLAPQLDALTADIATMSGAFKKEDLNQLSAIRLESLQNHWRFFDRELAKWRRDLQKATAPYSDDAAELTKRRALWEATLATMPGGTASALRDRAGSILAQITQAEQALSGPLDHQIKLGRRANRVEASIEAGAKGVGAAIAFYDLRLRTIDAPPVWNAWGDTKFYEGEIEGTAAGLRLETEFMKQWGAANADRTFAYKVAALLLAPFMLWLAWRSRKIVTTEPEMRTAAEVLLRPVSAWLVLVLVGVPFWFPDAPLVLHQIALLLALIPVLRLLPAKVYEVLGGWPYVATALYVVYRLSFLLLGQPLYYRVYLLAVAIVTAGALIWLLLADNRKTANTVRSRIRVAAHFFGWLAVLALVVSTIANTVGNLSLAEMLCGAVLDSIYVGLALYAGANVLASMLRLLLARKAMTRFRVVTQHAGPLLASLTRLIMYAALAIWLLFVLNEFRIARPIFAWVRDVLTFPLEAGQISVTLGSILLFILSVWVALWVAKTVRYVLRDEMLPKMELPRGVANSVASLSYYALILIGLMIALAAAGFETSQFAIVVGALGVGIGFGLQNVVNNFVSGLILMFERPIQPGDVVEVSGTSGTVRAIGMRATTLTTFEGADVVVPNGTLLSEKLINWTLSDMNRRLEVPVGVAYGTDPRAVLALLDEVARATPGVASEPAPAIVFTGLGAHSLDFSIRAWTNDFGDWVAIRSDMTVRVYEALRHAGIEIPFPQRDLHLRSVSAEAGARLSGLAARKPDQVASTE